MKKPGNSFAKHEDLRLKANHWPLEDPATLQNDDLPGSPQISTKDKRRQDTKFYKISLNPDFQSTDPFSDQKPWGERPLRDMNCHKIGITGINYHMIEPGLTDVISNVKLVYDVVRRRPVRLMATSRGLFIPVSFASILCCLVCLTETLWEPFDAMSSLGCDQG
ncbi:hypothetical protein FCULG_00003585 [Fusarium culmorum]|uniref:Uncharacterized protein n=1 Tax=Fusarium culmorum TaxID=5516 RepID=A0A2T4H6E9_FUSCU|nr:hypothetical protein FCULG_00003585 [Fusarium culmorum]